MADERRSADHATIVAPILVELFRPNTALDVGPASGAWVDALRSHGVEAVGADTSNVFGLALPPGRRFDLVLCREVAEHLPRGEAERLVSRLVQLAPVVVLSSVAPGQHGSGPGSAWMSAWATRFAEHGYDPVDSVRRRIWNHPTVTPGFAQSTLVWVDGAWRGERAHGPLDLVHPAALDEGRTFNVDLDVPRAPNLSGLPSTFEELLTGGGVMIYLPRHGWRAEYSMAKLEEVGFQGIELVEGVDAFDPGTQVSMDERCWPIVGSTNPGPLAYTISMLRLMRQIIEENLPYMLIFEDDVLPHPMVGVVGEMFWLDTPRSVGWVYMGNQMSVPEDERRNAVVRHSCYCTHALIITQRGARRGWALLENAARRREDIEHFDAQVLAWMRQGKVDYVCWNGSQLPKAFPTSDEVGPIPQEWPADIAWATRDSGVFYQNYRLGSTTSSADVAYR